MEIYMTKKALKVTERYKKSKIPVVGLDPKGSM